GERDGDHDALPHAAGELMRILARAPARLGDADKTEHLHHALLDALAAEPLMQPQGLGDLAADGEDRIEAGHRLLEDHTDIVAADLAHGALAELEQVAPLETYRAPHLPARP